MQVNIELIHPNAKIPTYATDGSGCFDLYSLESGCLEYIDGNEIIRTGVKIEVPKHHVMLIFSRSGHGFKNDVRLANCVGVIDSDYRGEIMVKLTNNGKKSFYFNYGDRIAQALIIPYEQVQFNVVNGLSPTVRGEGGFGSTG